jgi:asparaginyl-tRNA synthetase
LRHPAKVRESYSRRSGTQRGPVYTDETQGSDSLGDGTPSNPFATVLGAFNAKTTVDIDVYTRKAATADDPTPDFQPASGSSLKKAKKLFEAQQRKSIKQAESAKSRESENAARAEVEAKKLKEAQAIVLTEPNTFADRIKVKQAVAYRGQRVRIFGWVHRLRQQGGLTFIVLRDGTGYLQSVLSGKLVSLLAFAS